jgi:extradiol dioxygenase family protein
MTQTIPASAKAIGFIVTRDREKARAFYGDVLGFKKTHEDNFALVYDMNGTMLRISTLKDHAPQQHTVLGWEVSDIDAVAKALIAKGITFNRYPGLEFDALGIWNPDRPTRSRGSSIPTATISA